MSIEKRTLSGIGHWLWRNKFYSVCAAFVLYMFFFSGHSIYRILELQQQEENLRREIEVYRDSTASYERRIDEVSVDEEELERYAREVLRMHKENEELFLIK